LQKAANELGQQGIDWFGYCRQSSEVGTLTHLRIAAHLRKEDPPSTLNFSALQCEVSDACFANFLRFAADHEIKPVALERSISGILFGGTCDFVGYVDGRYVLLDWKTSNDVELAHMIQLHGYRELLPEIDVEQPNIVGILRLPKVAGAPYDYRLFDTHPLATAVFYHLLAAQEGLNELRGATNKRIALACMKG
jgi:hypothetical protein